MAIKQVTREQVEMWQELERLCRKIDNPLRDQTVFDINKDIHSLLVRYDNAQIQRTAEERE